MSKSKSKHDAAFDGMPSWAAKLAQHYQTGTISMFLLHGAVRDLQQTTDDSGGVKFVPLKEYLATELFGVRDIILYYDRSSGVRGATPEMQRNFLNGLSGFDAMFGTEYSKAPPKDPGRAFQILENYMRLRVAEGKSVAIIIDFAETLAPGGDMGHLSGEDRFTLISLIKWASDPQFLNSNISFCLIAENMAEISPRLTQNPYTASIEIALPNEAERKAFVKAKLEGKRLKEVCEVSAEGLSKMTAGLSRINLDRIFTEAVQTGRKITVESLKEKKKELLQAECYGLLEIIEPKWGLDVVAGHKGAKDLLNGAALALRKGRTDVLPMGYLFSGPVGTGKTFLASCFAKDIGVPCVRLLNFRSQWQGVTEGNLEKIFNLLKAMWPVAVIIDEADAALGNRNASGDSGTSSRVFASIASFMGNTEYRGKIIWFLLTCRPDLLPIDMKRQGRAEEHIALFYPQTDEERDELFESVAKKCEVDISGIDKFSSIVPDTLKQCSGSDIEAALVRAKFRALRNGHDKVETEDLKQVLNNFIPPNYPLEIELQNLVAIQECTSSDLIPQNMRHIDRSQITQRVRELKALLAEQ